MQAAVKDITRNANTKAYLPIGKELKDFYRFQLKEGKRDKLAELREQFEADKKKVQKMKLTNKFKGL